MGLHPDQQPNQPRLCRGDAAEQGRRLVFFFEYAEIWPLRPVQSVCESVLLNFKPITSKNVKGYVGISFEIYLRSTCEFGTLQGIQPHALSKSDKEIDGMRFVL